MGGLPHQEYTFELPRESRRPTADATYFPAEGSGRQGCFVLFCFAGQEGDREGDSRRRCWGIGGLGWWAGD